MKEKTVCIIPARGGSKRIPKKNIQVLGGKPLISYSIETAIKSGCFENVYVSSDDNEILDVASKYGAIPDLRSKQLSGDNVKAIDVIYEFVKRPAHRGKWDDVAMCLPTFPFRTTEDIKNAIGLFIRKKKTCPRLVGVSECNFLPQFVLKKIPGNSMMVDMREPDSYKGSFRGQDSEGIFFYINGSIYISTVEEYLKTKSFFGRPMLAHIIPPERSIDIDNNYQLKIAEFMMSEFMKIKERR